MTENVGMDALARYLDLVEELWAKYPEQREGQVYYNALRTMWPGLEQEIVGTELDPFTVDRRLPAFLAWVERRLGAGATEVPPAAAG